MIRVFTKGRRSPGRILSIAFLTLLALAQSALAATQVDINTLAEAVRSTGTSIVERDNCEAGLKGYYEFQKDQVDRITLCTNNIADIDELWEVQAHEVTHVIQACDRTGEPQAFDDAYFPRIFRELQQLHPSSINDTSYYGSWSKRQEIEARYMALKPPRDVIEFFYASQCFIQN